LPLVECYPSQINQVLLNILTNALDAIASKAEKQSFPNPTITIKTGVVDQQCLIQICDNGMGMPPEIVDKIFNPFFTTKPIGQGTGLGLSVSYSIIHEQHRGRLLCSSILNEGTEFTILIPLSLS